MSGGIYLVQGERLVEMTEQGYASESLLQDLLARHPHILAGDLMASTPRRWLLISQEVSLASEEDRGGRWSVDHLFVDQDAVPTLVEVKRSSDTRIRREVVGQMMDYAANAVVPASGKGRHRAELLEALPEGSSSAVSRSGTSGARIFTSRP